MIKKILKPTALLIAVLGTCIAIVWFTPLKRDNYLGAIEQKHRLLKTTPLPRIIFVGGSNVAFGLDSRLIHEALGYNVVNMGLHAGVGLQYMVNEIKSEIKEGDVVVVIPEYPFYPIGDQTLLELILFFPKGIAYMSIPQYIVIAKRFPVTLQRRFKGFIRTMLLGKANKPINIAYSKKYFNRYGDAVGHLNQKSGIIPNLTLIIPDTSEESIALLNRFRSYLDRKGAKFFFVFPPCPKSYFEPQKEKADRFYTWLKKNLNVQMLGKPRDFVYPETYFYDTIFHLNKKGRYIRSIKLIEELKKVLKIINN